MQIALLFAFMVVAQVSEPCTSEVLSHEVSSRLHVKDGPDIVTVTITARTRSSREEFGDRFRRGQFPDAINVVTEVKIVVNGEALYVPRSVFLDVAGVRKARVCWKGSLGQLIFNGGDGSESFRVEVEFDRTATRRRTVFSGELPTKPLEETRYHQVSL